jgi:TetR/AcrR family transcriptional regulator, regulator of cefoperazone and chloramphenicol sensitivity
MMNDKRRGQRTKETILERACKVFAEKGYRDATHAEICRRSGKNVAAVNYYFESKEALYRAVIEHLIQEAETLYPLDGGLSATASPQDRLRAFIHALLSRMFDPERLGDLHRIRMAEMFDSTGLLVDPLQRRLAQDREHILRILREMLGPQVPQKDVEWCELSIVGQCFMAAPGPDGKGPRVIFGLDAAEVDRLAEHILTFSMAGIEAIRRKSRERLELTRDMKKTDPDMLRKDDDERNT